jgi:hypothetical protein
MAEFSATDAALEGFRITRERPRDVAVWAVLMLLANLVASALIVTLAGEAFTAVMGGRTGGGDPEETLANLSRLGPLYALLVPLAVLFSSVLTAAIYRAVLGRAEGGPGHLALGADELRLAGSAILVSLLFVGIIAVVAVVAGLMVGGLGASGGLGGAVAAVALLPILLLLPLAFFAVRFSLALPATFAERRIRVFESWRLTKGRFWPLLGMFVLAIVLALVIYLLAMMIYFAVATLAGGVAGAGSAFQPDFSSFGALLSVPKVIYAIITALVSAVTTAITTAPAMAAYRDITGYGRDTAEVFS